MDVAIVIPCWNHGRFLAACLESVLGQDLPPAEVVVVDDASTDDTPAVVEPFVRFGVSYLRLPARVGTARAFTIGVAATQAPWVQPMGADDYVPANYLARHAAAIAAYDGAAPLGLAYSRARYVRHGVEIGWFGGGPWNPALLQAGNYVHGCALVARAAWDAVGGFREEPHEDWQCWRRIAAAGFAGVFVPDTWLYYRQHELGHRNYGTDGARDRDWGGRPVDVTVPNAVFA